MLTKSTVTSKDYLLDWAGNSWMIPSLATIFMTIEEAKNTSGSMIGTYSNNYIVLKNLNTVSSTWTRGRDKPGPTFAKVDLGFRGCKHDYLPGAYDHNYQPNFLNKVNSKIKDIVNLYNHDQVVKEGRYNVPEPEPEPEPEETE